jgi:hypothetical protein
LAALTLRELEGRLLAMVHNKVDSVTARMFIDNQYRTIFNSWGWSFTKIDDDFNTFGELSGGTVTLTNGANTIAGSGTAFTSNYDGGYMRVDSNRYEVSSFTNTTTGTFTGTYAGTTGGSKTYTLYKSKIELVKSAWNIITLAGDQGRELVEVTQEYLNRVDERRASSGTPLFYAYGGIGSGGGRLIELWPAPATAGHYNYVAMKHGALTLTTSSGTVEEMLTGLILKSAAQQAAMYIATMEAESAQAWIALAQMWKEEWQAEMLELQMLDLTTFGAPNVMKGAAYGVEVDSGFASKHDLLDIL